MIDLKQLDVEYNNYKKIRNLYIKYNIEFSKFNKQNSEKLTDILNIYNIIKKMKGNSSKKDTPVDAILEIVREQNPLLKKWYELDCLVKKYQNELREYSHNTYAIMERSKCICLKHKEDDGYDLIDLDTQERLDLSQYDNSKQQYIINDLKNHHSFIGYVTQDELPILMQVYKELDKEVIYNDTDTEEEMEEKCWDEMTRCYTIEQEFEKRKKSAQLKKVNNIEHEKKLLELLGYNLIGPDKSNRWLILDENNKQVGFIQYKKLFKKNVKKGTPAIYGYHTEIDSKGICYNATRKINDIQDKNNYGSIFNYELDIKRENNDVDHLEFNVGETPSLTLWSKEYGFMRFQISSDKLFLNFQSKTENFNVQEIIVYQLYNRQFSNLPNEYTYQLNYCNKDIDLNDDFAKGIKGRLITGKSSPEQQDHNEIKILERSWINNKLRVNRESVVIGNLEEMITKHKMGIDSFKHFRFLINQILPFKQEVVSTMLGEKSGENLSLFIPELGKVTEKIAEQKSNRDCKENNGIKKMHEVASKLTREKSMEFISNREEYIQQQMQKIAEEEYQSEVLGMIEDENYNNEDFNMILGSCSPVNLSNTNDGQDKNLVKKEDNNKSKPVNK